MLKFNIVNKIILTVIIGLLLLKFTFNLSLIWILLAFIIWATLTIIGSFHIRWNYFLESINENYSVKTNVVSITFDDSPNPEFTEKALEILNKYNAKATFFCIGENVENNPNLLKKIISDGHTIGNHSYYHRNNFGFLSAKKVMVEINKTKDLIFQTTNLKLKLFRPPFGVTNPNIAKSVKNLKLISVGWSNRSYDTIAKDPTTVLNNIIKNLKIGDIILLHDSSDLSITVLEQLLEYLSKNKLKSITLDKLLNLDAYE